MNKLAVVLAILAAVSPVGAWAGAEEEIDAVVDGWHRAAATADESVFFGSMTEDAVYLGTDPAERWTRRELMEWSKAYFDGASAWAFEPHDRFVYVSGGGDVAWFEELLDTWMGTCRGSGVLLKRNGRWKIAHYHLAVTVPNELMEDYVGLVGAPGKPGAVGGD